jgi:PKD repeat protein
VNFTDASTNSPLTYGWDFGDGGTSTQQSPSHVYTANGSYNVCLTVSNVSGQGFVCDTVVVTGVSSVNNPPIANRDSAQIIFPNTATINLLANDIDPDGDNIVYNIFFPPLNGTVTHTGNGMIEYEANAGFRGVDSFFYKISDEGSPVKSDTGTVVITVGGVPFANFTYSTNNFDVTFQNLSSGADSISWDLDDGTIATTNTVVHTYLRNSYEVCLTAFNSFGQDDTCMTINLTRVGINAVDNSLFSIYPNPATNKVVVDAKGLTGEHTITVYNNIGKAILQKNFDKETIQLEVTTFPAGIYGIQITDAGNKLVLSRSIVINK